MFTNVTKALLGMVAVATATQPAARLQASTPGLGGSITKAGVNDAKDAVVPYIFSMLKNITIAEVDFDGGWFKNLQIALPQPPVEDVNINTDHAENGVELVASSVAAEVSGDFSYKVLFLTVTGNVDIVIKDMAVDLEIDLGTQPSTPSYELAPKLTVSKSVITINPDDVDVTLTGGAVAKIASVFIPFIKSTIIPSVVTTIESTIKTTIATTVDADLAIYGSQETIPYLAGVTADYAQMMMPLITSDNIFEMALNGTFFDKENVQHSAYTPVTFPVHDPNGKGFQGYLSQYTVNTLFEAGYMTGNTLDVSYLLSKLGVTVTTDDLAVAIPEVLAKYGSGHAVTFLGKFITSPSLAKFTSTENQFDVNLEITVQVEGDDVLKADFKDIQAIFALSSSSGKIFGKVAKNSVGEITSLASTISGMTAASLQAELQAVVDNWTAVFNQDLAAGITVPTIMGINVGDIELNCNNGFVEAGVEISPAFFQLVKKVLITTADELRNIRAMNKLAAINELYKVDRLAALQMMEE